MKDLMFQTRIGDLVEIGSNNDLQIDPFTGDIMLVGGSSLLKQLICKSFLTEKGENTLLLDWGTNIYDYLYKRDTSTYLDTILEEIVLETLASVHYTTMIDTDPNVHISYIESVSTEVINSQLILHLSLFNETNAAINTNITLGESI